MTGDLASGSVWGALAAIIIANILLSGDNAVVIAMAARSLPQHQQKRAILWGSAAAIALRVALTLAAVQLLQLPGLKLAGGALLLWIGAQLLVDSDDTGEVRSSGTLVSAVRTILLADLVMSTDNVIAVAGAADRAPADSRAMLVLVGLATSIPLIIVGSRLLITLMDRWPIIILLGAALLGFVAGAMIVTDPLVEAWFKARWHDAETIAGAVGAVLVVALGKWLQRRSQHARS